MYVKTHLKETLKLNPTPSPWPKMVICMIATVLPLIVGYGTHQLALSVFGALTGFLSVLNDHMGTLKHRLLVISMTFIFLVAGFRLGVFTHAFPYMPIPLIVFLHLH